MNDYYQGRQGFHKNFLHDGGARIEIAIRDEKGNES